MTETEEAETEPEAESGGAGGERIAKVMARAGLCSRREAERWIAEGRVTMNGRVLESPALNITPADAENVIVDGKALAAKPETRLWRYHKAAGLMTTHNDPQGRPTVFGALPGDMPRVVSVGRLDFTSEGLLLLTNDGALARKLELPATGWRRRYRVRAHGRIDENALAALKRGVTVSGVRYGSIEARVDRAESANIWMTVTLSEGKNREIRRVMEHLGLTVNRLIRAAYGPFQLGSLPPGGVSPVAKKALRANLGKLLES
ncbi:MAG: pseudouridine synthase [Rhodospirillales bacterium]